MTQYKPQPRTNQQNRALHKFFSEVSQKMCDGGLTVQHILSFTADMQPTPSFVKRLWQEFQLKLLGKRHTRHLSKLEEIDQVYDEFNLFLAEKLHMENVPFPDKGFDYQAEAESMAKKW